MHSYSKADALFDVHLIKPGTSLGFNFKKPEENSPARGFLLVTVLPGGVLGQYNAAQAVAGRWDRVVLPGMRICAVNGIESPVGAMLQELKDKQSITLRVETNRRMSPSQPGAFTTEHRETLRARVAKLLDRQRDRLKQATASDEEWTKVSSSLCRDVVREVGDVWTQQLNSEGQGQAQVQLAQCNDIRPASAAARAYDGSHLNLSTSDAEVDDEVMSEESV